MLVHADQVRSRPSHISKLDLREFERHHHISVIFERLDDLGAYDHLFVICGCDPRPLRRRIEAWCPGQYAWLSIGSGPPVWAAEITRLRHRIA
jgi:uncharacterized protein (DUF2249 family)